MENLKVLMMGGRRCGKTSALASLFDQMKNTPEIYNLLTVSDKTKLDEKPMLDGLKEKKESLNNKKLELQNFLKKYIPSDFLVDKGPTRNWWLYMMQITLAGTNKTMMMEFRDSAGEFFDFGGKHSEETEQYVADCDVYIIVVDTPYLMCDDDVVCDAANVTDSIHSFLTSIDKFSDEGQEPSPKMVMFVPIKCEKWLHEGTIAKVNAKIKDKYAPTIHHLMGRPNTDLSIIPIETAGDIEFSEMRDSHVVISSNGTMRKCSKVTDRMVVLGDGTMYRLKSDDVLNDDPEGVFSFDGEAMDIPRPSSWFHHRCTTPQYHPRNCEQVALHVLRFYLNVTKKHRTGSWFEKFLGRFGRITLDNLNSTLVELYNRGMIKENKEGIECLKKYQ